MSLSSSFSLLLASSRSCSLYSRKVFAPETSWQQQQRQQRKQRSQRQSFAARKPNPWNRTSNPNPSANPSPRNPSTFHLEDTRTLTHNATALRLCFGFVFVFGCVCVCADIHTQILFAHTPLRCRVHYTINSNSNLPWLTRFINGFIFPFMSLSMAQAMATAMAQSLRLSMAIYSQQRSNY